MSGLDRFLPGQSIKEDVCAVSSKILHHFFYPECKVMQIRECNVFVIYTQKCWMRWEKEALARLHQLCLLGWGGSQKRKEEGSSTQHQRILLFCF